MSLIVVIFLAFINSYSTFKNQVLVQSICIATDLPKRASIRQTPFSCPINSLTFLFKKKVNKVKAGLLKVDLLLRKLNLVFFCMCVQFIAREALNFWVLFYFQGAVESV